MRKSLIAIAVGGTLLWTAIGAALLWPDRDSDPEDSNASGGDSARAEGPSRPDAEPGQLDAGASVLSPQATSEPEPGSSYPIRVRLKEPPRAGILFDVDTGEILWAVHPDLPLPVASLTKLMTGLLIAERHQASERVMITREAAAFRGSGVGVLPQGKKVRLGVLLAGLMLVSGNDAAIALAQHDAGTVRRFVARMNRHAVEMGLTCTHFTTPHGLKNPGNHSCARDLAELASADLANPRLARLAAVDRLRFPFPIKGGRLDLSNNNAFVRRGDPGITGLKTGYTHRAGRCYVVTQRRAGRHLGVVLLASPDPLRQVPKVLARGFASDGKPIGVPEGA